MFNNTPDVLNIPTATVIAWGKDVLDSDMDFRVLTSGSDDDKWVFGAWSSAPDHVMRFVDDCVSRIEQRPTGAWDVAAEMCFSTGDSDDERAAKLAKLRAKYDTSEPAGIMNPEQVVNNGLEFAPAWLSQDGMDLPTPTVIDDAFKEKLLSHFGLTSSGCPLDCSEKVTDTATQGETHRQALVALLLRFAHLFASSDATLQPVTLVECQIQTHPEQKPVSSAPYPLSPDTRKFVREQLITLLRLKLIQRSTSP